MCVKRLVSTAICFLLATVTGCDSLERSNEPPGKQPSQAAALDGKQLSAHPDFAMGDNLMCTILQSSQRGKVGQKISFIGLTTVNPKVLFESGVTSPIRKEFESENTLTSVLVASGTGSVDSLVLDKLTGKFARIEVAAPFLGESISAVASLGACR